MKQDGNTLTWFWFDEYWNRLWVWSANWNYIVQLEIRLNLDITFTSRGQTVPWSTYVTFDFASFPMSCHVTGDSTVILWRSFTWWQPGCPSLMHQQFPPPSTGHYSTKVYNYTDCGIHNICTVSDSPTIFSLPMYMSTGCTSGHSAVWVPLFLPLAYPLYSLVNSHH